MLIRTICGPTPSLRRTRCSSRPSPGWSWPRYGEGGLLASVDGLRFVVPSRTINAAPSPKFFGYKRGLTWLNPVNDQVMGIDALIVPGTVRDSLFILGASLSLDRGVKREMIATDHASYSDAVFGLFKNAGLPLCPAFSGPARPAVLARGSPGWAADVRPRRTSHPVGSGDRRVRAHHKTMHLLSLVEPVDDTYRRRMNRRLTVQESLHRLAG